MNKTIDVNIVWTGLEFVFLRPMEVYTHRRYDGISIFDEIKRKKLLIAKQDV